MTSESLCKICQRPHRDGLCVEMEQKTSARAEKLFSRLDELTKNPPNYEGLTKKEKAAKNMLENIDADKLKFLTGLASSDKSINIDDIQKLFLRAPEPEKLTDPNGVSSYLIGHIRLKMLEGGWDEALKQSARYVKEFPNRAKAIEGLYAFCLENNSPVAVKFADLAFDNNVSPERLAAVEANVQRKLSTKDRRVDDAAIYARTVRGARNLGHKDIANEMEYFAEQYMPDFLDVIDKVDFSV